MLLVVGDCVWVDDEREKGVINGGKASLSTFLTSHLAKLEK